MIIPTTIPTFSIPYLGMGFLLFVTSLFFFGFFFNLPRGNLNRKGSLLFGFTCLFLGFYSLATVVFYSVSDNAARFTWVQIEFALSLPVVTFFFLFSAHFLELKNWFFRILVPISILAFLPLFLIPGLMVGSDPRWISPKIFGYPMEIPIYPFGVGGLLLLVIVLLEALILGMCWVRHIFLGKKDIPLALAFLVFVACGVSDILVSFGFYSFPSIFVLGFSGFLIAMAWNLFTEYTIVTRQLRQRTHELQEINEEMRFLVGNISHDIMGPLVSINGFTELLLDAHGRDPKQFKHYVDRIRANSDHMKALLSDLATYLQVGRTEEEIQKVDLYQIAHQVLAIVDLPNQYPHAKVSLPEKWPSFTGSPKRLKQVLLNLIQNSLKYNDKPEALIKVECERQGARVFFSVTDNGPGVPPELRERIFETFFRNHPKTPGTGMGLAIIRKAIENHGGKVWVDETFSEGARFCFYLPHSPQGTHLVAPKS